MGQGKTLGLILFFIGLVLGLAAGVFLFVRGLAEDRAMAQTLREEKLLSMVQAQGQIAVADAAIELNVSRDQVKAWIYDLVGKGLFTGYINWNDGILYSRDAASMQSRCPSCGGVREVAGKGVVRCAYCGSELFV